MLKVEKKHYYIRFGLGDRWASISYLLRKSQEKGRPVFIDGEADSGHLYELASYFDTTGQLIYEKGRSILPMNYHEAFSTKYLPTKKTWRDTNSKVVAYQFDGVTSFWDKNPSDKEITEFLNHLTSRGFTPVDLGHMKPLPYIIETLTTCKFFVGCASGIGHISMSVNTPMCIILHNLPEGGPPPYGAEYQRTVYSSKPDVQFFKYLKDLMNHLG
jgi:ADP-heptose:LPS heptosyltransferase